MMMSECTKQFKGWIIAPIRTMMKFSLCGFVAFLILAATATASAPPAHLANYTQIGIIPVNNCVQFQVSAGTGCAWMCNYCANALSTFNYYFPDGVCTYQTGGCVGNPLAGKVYTCCSV